ncbi:hypothetical protein [Croceicoccus naphthovorans]|uniref:hypothetical protein n=1 Tax=Croceicoccus naphthovorans TaxID=1348774 RepID=UPI000A4695DA|nr:hypothetical protein [Croceicoccus naphthovorans]MBB3989926.1 hypothetical protein [Croceicoccus naphthovorans]
MTLSRFASIYGRGRPFVAFFFTQVQQNAALRQPSRLLFVQDLGVMKERGLATNGRKA